MLCRAHAGRTQPAGRARPAAARVHQSRAARPPGVTSLRSSLCPLKVLPLAQAPQGLGKEKKNPNPRN